MKQSQALLLVIVIAALLLAIGLLIAFYGGDEESTGTDFQFGNGLALQFQVVGSFGGDIDARIAAAASRVRAFLSNAIKSYTGSSAPHVLVTNTATVAPLSDSGLAYAVPSTAQIFVSASILSANKYTTYFLNGIAETMEFVVLLHETLHLLGLTGIINSQYVQPAPTPDKYKWTGANATAALNNLLHHCNDNHSQQVTYIALEDDGGGGTALYHLDENNEWHTEIPNCSVLRNDISSGFLGTQSNFTTVTLGLLQDHGYEVDNTTETMSALGIPTGESQACANYSASYCN